MILGRAALATVVVMLAPSAGATVVYKSVPASGVVEFSDQLPPGTSKLLEVRELVRPPMSLQADMQMPVANAAVTRTEGEPADGPRLEGRARDEVQQERIEYDRMRTLGGRHTLLDLLLKRLKAVTQ
jgi:hypothetical protein